jgi:hypothetical protein
VRPQLDEVLDALREQYRRASKKEKGQLLSEARKRTRLNRKVLLRKLAHPPKNGRALEATWS